VTITRYTLKLVLYSGKGAKILLTNKGLPMLHVGRYDDGIAKV